MPFSVVYDACVLHPPSLRDLLIRVARAGIVQARWSEEILDECFGSIRRERPEIREEQLQRTRTLMNAALPGANVTGYASLVSELSLRDSGDRHVLAAAIRSSAQAPAIVTFNIADFPDAALRGYDIEAKHPDEFVMNCIDIAPAIVVRVVTEQAGDLQRPPVTVAELLGRLRARGLVQSVARLNDLMLASAYWGR